MTVDSPRRRAGISPDEAGHRSERPAKVVLESATVVTTRGGARGAEEEAVEGGGAEGVRVTTPPPTTTLELPEANPLPAGTPEA